MTNIFYVPGLLMLWVSQAHPIAPVPFLPQKGCVPFQCAASPIFYEPEPFRLGPGVTELMFLIIPPVAPPDFFS